jgi:hypothetical protein
MPRDMGFQTGAALVSRAGKPFGRDENDWSLRPCGLAC